MNDDEYSERLMILPHCPPVLRCCSEGHSVDHPAGTDLLYRVNKEKREGESKVRKKRERMGHRRSQITQMHRE